MVTKKATFIGPFLAHRFFSRLNESCRCGGPLYQIHEDYVIAGGSMIEEYTYCAACGAEWHAHDESIYPLPKVEAEF